VASSYAQGHLDPTTVPPWLMEAAKVAGPDAMGWLAAGYLAGVDVGRRSGPCTATADGLFGETFRCALAHGHPGAHQTDGPTSWTERQPENTEGDQL
jgi:hypothetical protein